MKRKKRREKKEEEKKIKVREILGGKEEPANLPNARLGVPERFSRKVYNCIQVGYNAEIHAAG